MMTPINGPRWTVAAATALAITIGGTGYALASSGGGNADLPQPISLRDRVPVTATPGGASSLIEVVPGPVWRLDATGSLTDSLSDNLTASLSDTLDSTTADSDSVSADSVSVDSDSLDSMDSTA